MKRKMDYRLNMHIDKSSSLLRSFFLLGLYMLIFLSPFWRGLFFEQDLLPAVVLASIAFLLCIIDQFLARDNDFWREPLDIAMLALLLAYLLSIINAVHRHDAIVELLKISTFVMVYWMAVRAGKNERDFKRLLLAAYLAAVGMAIIGLGAAMGWVHFEGAYEQGHIRSTLQYHNALAIYLAAMNIVGLALSLRTERSLSRLAYTGGNYLLVVVILGSLSRGTWLLYPLAMGAFIFLIPAAYRRRAGYQLLMFIGAGLWAGRLFFNNLNHSQELAALAFLLIGLLLAMSANIIKLSPRFYPGNLEGKFKKSKSLLTVAGIALLILAIFFIANPTSLTGVMRYIVPDTAIARAQKTSVQDTSFKERLTTNKDALKIIAGHPVIGVGGGGWQALYHSYASSLYWVNEVHNFYLQIWLEAGTLGFMAAAALAFFFLRMLIRSRVLSREYPDSIEIWAVAAAVALMAVHSSFDFELSMAAVGFLFFALIGLLRGRTTALNNGLLPEQPRRKDKRGKQPDKSYLLLMPFLLAILLALSAGLTALAFHTAAGQADRGAKELEAHRLEEAQSLFQKANRLDPYKGAYQVNMAQAAAIEASQGKNASAYNRALDHAQKASGLEPYNPSLHTALFSIYGMLSRPDLQIREMQAAIRVNPFLAEPYELLSKTAMPAALSCMDRGQRSEANTYFEMVVRAREKMPPALAQSIPIVNLAAGQASLLLGDIDQAGSYLTQALQGDKSCRETASLWLAGVDYLKNMQGKTGRSGASQDIDLNALLLFLNQQQRH